MLSQLDLSDATTQSFLERAELAESQYRVLLNAANVVIAISNHGALDRGASLIVKPFDASDLTRRTREVLDRTAV